MLIRFAAGAVFTVIIMALVTPLTTLFWNLFTTVPDFHWAPFFDQATVLVLLGLAMMMPAVILYTYFADPESEIETAATNNDATAVPPPVNHERSRMRRKSDPIPASIPHVQRERAKSLTPKLVPYKSPNEVPLRYRDTVPPRRQMSRSASSGFLPPIEDKETKRKRKLKLLQTTLTNQKTSHLKRVKSAPVLMGGF